MQASNKSTHLPQISALFVLSVVPPKSLQFLTAPVGAHMVGRAAYHAGGLVDRGTRLDELATAELGVDRIFGRGTTPGEVASFLVHRILTPKEA